MILYFIACLLKVHLFSVSSLIANLPYFCRTTIPKKLQRVTVSILKKRHCWIIRERMYATSDTSKAHSLAICDKEG
jgi:hypothetical protein